jgi:hypothetical protein
MCLPGGGFTLDFFLVLRSASELTELVEELSDIFAPTIAMS